MVVDDVEAAKQQPPPPESKCWACREPLNHADQKICLNCESWQTGLRRWINLSTPFVGVLTGLVGVTTALFAIYQNYLRESQLAVMAFPNSIQITRANKNVLALNIGFQNQTAHRVHIKKEATCVAETGSGPKVTFILPKSQRSLAAAPEKSNKEPPIWNRHYRRANDGNFSVGDKFTCMGTFKNKFGYEEGFSVSVKVKAQRAHSAKKP